jgi:hypothetical protein
MLPGHDPRWVANARLGGSAERNVFRASETLRDGLDLEHVALVGAEHPDGSSPDADARGDDSETDRVDTLSVWIHPRQDLTVPVERPDLVGAEPERRRSPIHRNPRQRIRTRIDLDDRVRRHSPS